MRTFKKILLFAAWVIFFALIFVLFGWALIALWNWIVPLFWKTAPILTIWQGVGILLFIGLLKLIFLRQ